MNAHEWKCAIQWDGVTVARGIYTRPLATLTVDLFPPHILPQHVRAARVELGRDLNPLDHAATRRNIIAGIENYLSDFEEDSLPTDYTFSHGPNDEHEITFALTEILTPQTT